ncbi:hypothetical protein M3Y98_00628400 [Aphelenchoides besseyi]|nr:hypothetical protein M3Y98_00628400 [Aphelenchoides besseyi]KAI6208451.1 hypothetical protein M3Y96_00116700 [Aphelenchoides besseyi]
MVVGLNPEAINGRELSTFQYSEAGIISGLMTRAIIQPLDVLKIRFQLQEEPMRGKTRGKYSGIFQSVKLIVKEEGVGAFWKGHVPAQMLSAIYGLVQFSTFEMLTKRVSKYEHMATYKKTGDFFCGAVAGCCAMTCAMPLDVIRTRLVAQGEPKIYKSTYHAARKIWKHEKVPGFFRGIVPSLSQVAPYTGLQFALYNFFSKRWNKYLGHESTGALFCGATAGTLAKTALYPLDLIRHRLQVNAAIRRGFGKTSVHKGMFKSLTKIVRREGLLGLFKGLSPSMVKAGANSGKCFAPMNFDALPFIFKRDVIDYATLNNPTVLLAFRLLNKEWKQLVEAVLNKRSWYIQARRLNFPRLSRIANIDPNVRILRGLNTLVDEDNDTANGSPDFAGELHLLREFIEKPKSELNCRILFLHGTSGNGTTHLLRQLADHYSACYDVVFIDGLLFDFNPDAKKISQKLDELKQQKRVLLIIDDADKLFLDYISSIGGNLNSPQWYAQRDGLLKLFNQLTQLENDIRVILTSNESTLWNDELKKHIELVIHIPYKNQRERLRLLYQFTRDMRLCSSISLESIVKRLNGHVVKALHCVCQKAAALAILNGTNVVEERFFDKAIQHVVFRQGIRPFVIRPKPNISSIRNPLTLPNKGS